jgi:hypothetical protein
MNQSNIVSNILSKKEMTSASTSSTDESTLLNELRMKDESLTKEMYENPSEPDSVLNILMKKLQLYNDIEFALTEPRNKILVGFMKIPVENRILITQIKKDLDEQISLIIKRLDTLESTVKEKHNERT